MRKVHDTLNNKKMPQEPQHYIMNIYNIDNDDRLEIKCEGFKAIASIYFSIVIGLEEFPAFKTVHEKQEYELRLDSQQIESILIKYDEIINLNPKSMEDLPLINAVEPLLNAFKELLEDVE